ncbi:MAG: ATP-binding protein [Pirellulaceae bacterium]|nr:ATP-binding protein [Pirellulaceae bacterium]
MQTRAKWHFIYFALAAFSVFAVLSGLALTHEIMTIYRGSVDENKLWADRVRTLGEMSLLAQKTNAPGNDIFETKQSEEERGKLNQALAEFHKLNRRILEDYSTIRNVDDKAKALGSLDIINSSMDRMVAEAEIIFTHFENEENEIAATRMAIMDRKYAAVTNAITDASDNINAIITKNFQEQIANAYALRKFEYALAIVIFIMVLSITVYGRKLARVMQEHEEALQAAKVQAQEGSRAKSEFLASMSHEIRTPMNGILGTVANLLGGKLSPHQREQVQIIKESGDALLEIINDILDLSKVEAGRLELEFTDFKVSHLLDTTVALWESRAQTKGLKLKIENKLGELDVIRADFGRIRQVLYNLISNAIKFTAVGSITIYVKQLPRSEGDAFIRFEVHDTGIGLDDEGIAKIFKPFTQANTSTTRKYGGTGLGLSICKKIVELHGGKIDLESRPGEGSCFWFQITAEEGDPEKLIEEDAGGEEHLAEKLATIGKTLKILVAEDNHINQKVLRTMLQSSLNCHADFVGNGLEAVQQVQSQRYDLVLMDVQMPEMDGLTATRKIRGLADLSVANIPIIALTANAMKGDRENYLEAGMNDYASKPIEQVALLGAILRCVDNPGIDVQSLHSLKPKQQPLHAGPLSPEMAADLTELLSNIEQIENSLADAPKKSA